MRGGGNGSESQESPEPESHCEPGNLVTGWLHLRAVSLDSTGAVLGDFAVRCLPRDLSP